MIFRPNEESQFVLRLFCEKLQHIRDESSQKSIVVKNDEEHRPITDENEQIFYDFFQKVAGKDQAISGTIIFWSLESGQPLKLRVSIS